MGIPALVLLYWAIDGMAWVSVSGDRHDVNSTDFKTWVESYLLPDSHLDCDADDLWAARCGVVHSQIMDSRKAREGRARHIWYHIGPGNRYFIPIHEVSKQQPLTISIDVFVAAFRQATKRFFEAIERDSEIEKRVWPRAQRDFDEVRVFGRPGEAGLSVHTIPTFYD